MRLTKAETWALAKGLGGEALVELIVEESHTCYLGERGALHPWGYGCGTCPACELRARGWRRLGRAGPARRCARMSYAVKEIFLTLQGEGGQAGRPAVFCRFAGCNLWSGREQDRAERGLHLLRHRLRGHGRPGRRPLRRRRRPWPTRSRRPGAAGRTTGWWCCTGGEPLLQLDDAADRAPCTPAASRSRWRPTAPCRRRRASTGSASAPRPTRRWRRPRGQELKLVYPQAGVDPARFEGLGFERFLLQPMDGPDRAANTEAAIAYCLAHPRWRLSVQTHKYLGIA